MFVMIVSTINRVINMVQIITETGSYTCPIKEERGELFFLFKKQWHKVMEFTSEITTEFISKDGGFISRRLKK